MFSPLAPELEFRILFIKSGPINNIKKKINIKMLE
jgi:hypothetical protein